MITRSSTPAAAAEVASPARRLWPAYRAAPGALALLDVAEQRLQGAVSGLAPDVTLVGTGTSC
jgi:hypothetical protein